MWILWITNQLDHESNPVNHESTIKKWILKCIEEGSHYHTNELQPYHSLCALNHRTKCKCIIRRIHMYSVDIAYCFMIAETTWHLELCPNSFKGPGEKNNLKKLEARQWNHVFAYRCFSEVGNGTEGQNEQGDGLMRNSENRVCL